MTGCARKLDGDNKFLVRSVSLRAAMIIDEISFQARSYSCREGIHRASLRVQKVSNVPASKPMKLLAAVNSFLDTLVWMQLCNPQGIALFSFVRLPTPVRSPFASTRVYGMLTHAERHSPLSLHTRTQIIGHGPSL
jgi:hypothetical protein